MLDDQLRRLQLHRPPSLLLRGGARGEFEDWRKGLSNLAKVNTKKKAAQTLRLEIDDEAFDTLYGHESRPFPVEAGQQIAVRVISQFGEETTRILTVP